MPNRPSLKTVRGSFDRRLQSACDLFGAVESLAVGDWDSIQGWEALYPGHARRVAALAFMYIVIGWEDLVEGSFIRYLLGARAPSGWSPRLRIGPASTIDHAYRIVSGSPSFRRGRDYLSWSNWSEVIERAGLFFANGAPYTKITRLQRDRLADAAKIRNRVAHSSEKCRREFVEIAKRHLGISASGRLPKGFDVGQLLVNKSSKCFGPGVSSQAYFYHYLMVFAEMADRICPV